MSTGVVERDCAALYVICSDATLMSTLMSLGKCEGLSRLETRAKESQ